MIAHILDRKDIIVRGLIWSFGIAIIALFLFYVFFIRTTIANGVVLNNYQNEMAELQSGVAGLEAELFSLQSRITLDRAEEIGLVSSKNTSYISRATFSRSVSFSQGI